MGYITISAPPFPLLGLTSLLKGIIYNAVDFSPFVVLALKLLVKNASYSGLPVVQRQKFSSYPAGDHRLAGPINVIRGISGAGKIKINRAG